MRARTRLVLAIGALLVFGSAAGVAYGAVHSSVISATTADVVRTTTTNGDLNPLGGPNHKTQIFSVTLPKGSWVVTATLVPVSNYAFGDIFRCGLYKGTTKLMQAGAQVPGTNVIAENITLIAPVVSPTTPSAISVKCWHDGDMAGTPYIDPGAVLWAHRSTSIDAANV